MFRLQFSDFGVFRLLLLASEFNRHRGAGEPYSADLSAVARGFGLQSWKVERADQLEAALQGALEWYYTKFLCDKRGVPVKRFKSAFDPLDFEGDVRLLLAGKEVTPPECVSHPGRMVCNVDRILEA